MGAGGPPTAFDMSGLQGLLNVSAWRLRACRVSLAAHVQLLAATAHRSTL
jgi:hypothetical protein